MKTIKYSLTKQVADEIEKRIKDEIYLVGTKIPTEPELIEQFGVSRNTIREAMQALTNAGLLESRQGSGTYVIAKERFQVDFFNLLGKTNHDEIFEVRNLLEEHIVISACKNRTDEDLINISNKLKERNESTEKTRENTCLDMDFHIAIAGATHNSILLNIYKYLSQYFIEFIIDKLTIIDEKDNILIDNLHNELFHAIKEKNTENAKIIITKILNL